jgi:ribose/xylose/arabinose/galactoside ABC-type transport system permease subunit
MNEDPRATSIEQPSAGLASRGASSTGRLLITKSTRGILGRVRNASTLVMVIVCWVGLSLSNPYFFTALNVSNIFSHSANIALIAMGLTIVLVAGEIDLSVGSVEALGAAVSALLIVNGHLPVALAICATVGAGILAGSVSGLIRVLFRVPSFVTTLGMLSVASGIALVITNGNPVYGLPSSFTVIGQGSFGPIPVDVIIAVAIGVALYLLMTRTRFGLHVHVLGDSEWAARSVGLRISGLRVTVLALSGGLAALAGMIVAAEIASGNGSIGSSDLLSALAAVVIGGTSLFGGVGDIRGTALGVILIASLEDGLELFNVAAFWEQVVIGCLILGAVTIDYLLRPRGENSDR